MTAGAMRFVLVVYLVGTLGAGVPDTPGNATVLPPGTSPPAPGVPFTVRAYAPLFITNATRAAAPGAAFGVDFITSAQAPAAEARYARAAQVHARYDRVPFYWWALETAPGVYDWAAHDQVVLADTAHGYALNAILLMPPGFHLAGPCGAVPARRPQVGMRVVGARAAPGSDCTTPEGLERPVFADGTDVPGVGKTINPDHAWAQFVYRTVARYRPGGTLAQGQGWTAGQGVRVWEIWNEPDWPFFWNGSAASYARLLKTAYLAIRQADPGALVLFGGLSNIGAPEGRPTWLADVLGELAGDPAPGLREQMGWYFDGLGVHAYSNAWSAWALIYQHNNTLGGYGLNKQVWLNETGVPICDDYPGPACPNAYRASEAEAAAFEIEAAAYALFVGADAYLHFQLYDDCGIAYDAFGLFRNPRTDACNNGSPWPDSARQSVVGFNVAADTLGGLEPLWRQRPGGPDPYHGPQEWIAFYRPVSGERVLVVWARFAEAVVARIPATGVRAVRVDQTGARVTLTPVDGYYTQTLVGATNFSAGTADGSAMIGGAPYIFIELDERAPEIALTALPTQSPATFSVTWTGQDLGSGLGHYQLWHSVDGAALSLWLATPYTGTVYTGISGHTYGFALRALDRAGNWTPAPTTSQTSTYIP